MIPRVGNRGKSVKISLFLTPCGQTSLNPGHARGSEMFDSKSDFQRSLLPPSDATDMETGCFPTADTDEPCFKIQRHGVAGIHRQCCR